MCFCSVCMDTFDAFNTIWILKADLQWLHAKANRTWMNASTSLPYLIAFKNISRHSKLIHLHIYFSSNLCVLFLCFFYILIWQFQGNVSLKTAFVKRQKHISTPNIKIRFLFNLGVVGIFIFSHVLLWDNIKKYVFNSVLTLIQCKELYWQFQLCKFLIHLKKKSKDKILKCF